MDVAILSVALLAGSIAAFNPCGFALLPAYLGLIARSSTTDPPSRTNMVRPLLRGMRFAAGMTVGFMVVFGIAAAIFLPFAGVVARTLPYVTIGIGILLLAVGVWLLAGRDIQVSKLPGISGKAPTTTWFSQIGYGITFAVASLSCTIGPFLAMVSVAASANSAITSVAAYVAYALGMGLVVLSLAVIVTVTSGTLVSRIRNAAPVINRVSGGLLVLAGAYVAWYGWFELRILADPQAQDPLVATMTSVQSSISTTALAIFSSGLWFDALAIFIGGLLALAIAALLVRKVYGAWSRRKCAAVRRRVDRFLDSDPSAPLSDEELTLIEEHLAVCADCTQLVQDLRQMQRLLREFNSLDDGSLERVRSSWDKIRDTLRA